MTHINSFLQLVAKLRRWKRKNQKYITASKYSPLHHEYLFLFLHPLRFELLPEETGRCSFCVPGTSFGAYDGVKVNGWQCIWSCPQRPWRSCGAWRGPWNAWWSPGDGRGTRHLRQDPWHPSRGLHSEIRRGAHQRPQGSRHSTLCHGPQEPFWIKGAVALIWRCATVAPLWNTFSFHEMRGVKSFIHVVGSCRFRTVVTTRNGGKQQ